MARPTKLNPEVTAEICKGIREGLPYATASRLAGITEATRINWMNRGKAAKSGQFLEFFEAVSQAQAEAQKTLVEIVRDEALRGDEGITVTEQRDGSGTLTGTTTVKRSAPRNWRAAMAMLTARYPDQFGRHVVQHEGRAGVTAEDRVSVTLVFDDGEGEDDEND